MRQNKIDKNNLEVLTWKKLQAHHKIKAKASHLLKTYLEEMLDVLGVINKMYLENDKGDQINACGSHYLKRYFKD